MSTNGVNSQSTPAELNPSAGEKKWLGHSICTIDRLGWLFGVILMIGGIALYILSTLYGYDFHSAAIASSTLGGIAFFLSLITHCCKSKRCLEGGNMMGNRSSSNKPTKNYTPIPLTTSTKEFFESKGIFGLPEELMQKLQLWRRLRNGEKLDITMDAGFILYGPPGTGKTTIAMAVAELLGGEYYEKKCGDLKSKYHGDSEKNIDDLFSVPKEGFRVVTIDEISGILSKRRGQHWTDGVTEHFLGKVNGTENTTPNFILIGTTNHYERLDPAVVRRGRLGGQFKIDNPNEETRLAIFQHHLSKIDKDEGDWDNCISYCVGATEGSSCADIVGIVSDAREKALIAERKIVPQDFTDAIENFLQQK